MLNSWSFEVALHWAGHVDCVRNIDEGSLFGSYPAGCPCAIIVWTAGGSVAGMNSSGEEEWSWSAAASTWCKLS